MNLNEFDEAINDFKKVVLIEPTNQAALNRMAEIKAKKYSQEINNNKQSQEAKGAAAFIGAEGAKGQSISKCPFGVFKSSKKTNKIFSRLSALASKKRSNQKNKGTSYH